MTRIAPALAALLVAAAIGVGCGGDDAPEPAPLPEPPIFGFNEQLTAETADNELLAASGASFVRTPLNWAAIEQTEGEPDFSGPDAIAEALAEIGLRPFWVVTGAPCWAAARPCTRPEPGLAPAPDRFDEYASFAVEVAERYPESIGIEVWNEPNIPNFWRPEPDPAAYRALLSLTADEVHDSGSEVPVVMAGPSPTTERLAAEDPLKIEFTSFIRAIMGGPEPPAVDAIGAHPYSLLQRDADPIDESIRLFEEARKAARAVAPGVPIWVTEVGLTTAGRHAVSPQQQASGLERIVEYLVEAGVPVIALHRFFDQVDPPFAFEEGFGVVAEDRSTPKPAFCAPAEALGADCES